MKSIKEKAEEHGLEYPGIRYSHDDIYKDCDKPSMDFEAGANYATAKAVEWLKDFCNEHYIMSYADSSEVNTKEIIEIFKKKMEE